MSMNKSILNTFTIVSVLLPVLYYFIHIQYLGFPDGYLTDLDEAQKYLYHFFIWPSIGFFFVFAYLRWKVTNCEINKTMLVFIFIYLLFLLTIFLSNYYLDMIFDGGSGG